MSVPLARPSEVEYDVAFPNAIVRDAVAKGTPIPWEVDKLNNRSDQHRGMRVYTGPKPIRHRDIDERQQGWPLHAPFKCLHEYVCSLELRLNMVLTFGPET